MIKAIIFDSDNTLIDFSRIATPCIQKTAKVMGLKVPSPEIINKFWGRSLNYIIINLWGKKYIKEFRKDYFKIIFKYKFKEIKGAKETINSLKKKYKMAIISAKPKSLMVKNFRDINLDTKIFKFMLSADDTKYHKPDQRVFNGVAKKLGAQKNEVLYVGDSIVDFIATKKAGLNFVAVLTGSYTKKDFQKFGLKKENILKSIKELPKWLEKNG
ncbi:MAG: HAD-IA family hydrolase [Nanoarchaeota archaeon]